MLQKRLRIDLSVVTDKNHWKKLDEAGISVMKKLIEDNEIKQLSSSHRCDTPDKGGGKPDLRGQKKSTKIPEAPVQSRPKLATKVIKNLYYRIPRKNNTQHSSKDAVKQRSSSTKKIKAADLKKGSFSNKHSTSKEKIAVKVTVSKLAKDWKEGLRSSSVMRKSLALNKSPDKSLNRKNAPSIFAKVNKDSGYIQPWKKLMHEL